MTTHKIRVGLLFGGRSEEHEVSLQSAKSILKSLNPEKYEILLLGIDKQGGWQLHTPSQFLLEADDPKQIHLAPSRQPLSLQPGTLRQPLTTSLNEHPIGPIDVIFPALHGPFGEDGTLQGLLRLADIPFVGADVLGSAVGMDKDVSKRLLREAGLPIADFIALSAFQSHTLDKEKLEQRIGFPCFVKPANLGSSVGVHKVNSREELDAALANAFEFDEKVLIEEAIEGRELECGVLGNEDPIASCVGEVIPHGEFYSYSAKYIDENGATIVMPADLDDHTTARIQALACRVFEVLCCAGMARVDFFLKQNGEIIVNEINTIPGFTRISMYPKLWALSGLTTTELIDRLIGLALERSRQQKERLNRRCNRVHRQIS